MLVNRTEDDYYLISTMAGLVVCPQLWLGAINSIM